MRCYSIFCTWQQAVYEGIPVELEPYPHLDLGKIYHSTTRIPIGRRNFNITVERIKCPDQGTQFYTSVYRPNSECPECGEKFIGINEAFVQHPKSGISRKKALIRNVEIINISAEGKKPLIVEPPTVTDDRALVLIKANGGYRGGAYFKEDPEVDVIGYGGVGHECNPSGILLIELAIMRPGQSLWVTKYGRRVKGGRLGRVKWTGENFEIFFTDDEDDLKIKEHPEIKKGG